MLSEFDQNAHLLIDLETLYEKSCEVNATRPSVRPLIGRKPWRQLKGGVRHFLFVSREFAAGRAIRSECAQ